MPHRGKKYKTKQKPDNNGKLINFKSIWDIENKVSSVGWFEMDIIVEKTIIIVVWYYFNSQVIITLQWNLKIIVLSKL